MVVVAGQQVKGQGKPCDNLHDKIVCTSLAENKSIFQVTQVQITNSTHAVKISSLLTFCDAFFSHTKLS